MRNVALTALSLFPPLFSGEGICTMVDWIQLVIMLVCMCLLGSIVALSLRHQNSRKINPLLILIPAIISLLISFRFGMGREQLQGNVLCLILLYATVSDIRSREVPDFIPVLIAVSGLINADISVLPLRLLAALIITIPQLIVAILKPGSYGGADIKLMAASCFLLGINRGLIAIITGLLAAVICTVIARKIRRQNIKESFALVPYLSAGVMFAYFF